MSFVNAVPELLAASAQDLTSIGTTLSGANAAAAASTTGVVAAGADEVSQAIAWLFGDHAARYQSLSARVAQFHQQFVQALDAAGGAYASAEAANASPMQSLESEV